MTTTIASDQYRPAHEKGQTAVEQEQIQYTLVQILGIWALVALPMLLLTWVIAPLVIPYSPFHPGITFWLLMIAGMAWEFVVALAILYRELGTLRSHSATLRGPWWSAIRQRLWLQTPRDPGTGQTNARLYWLLLPLILYDGLLALVFVGFLDAPMTWLFPALKPAPFMEMSQLASPEFHGQWWILGITMVSFLFNYLLGEAFLWHGILLPRMQGVFGKYDWVANAVLFGLYHLHKPWALPSIILTNMAYSWPAKRFRSNWMAVIVHAAEGLPTLVMVLAVILGLVG